jgi:hypothetical protein
MRRALFAMVLLALGAGVGLTGWASARAHAQYRVWVQALSANPSLRVLDTAWSAGWLRSHAHTSFEVYGTAGAAYRAQLEALGRDTVRGRVGFRMEHHVEHGPGPFWRWLRDDRSDRPIVARIESHLDLDNETQAELADVTGPLPGVRATTLVRADGRADGVFQVPTQRLQPRTPVEVPVVLVGGRFKGLSGSLHVDAGGYGLRIELHCPGLEAAGPERTLVLAQWGATLEARRDPGTPWLGRLQQGIGRLAFEAPAGAPARGFAVEGLDWVQSSEARAGALRAALELRAARLEIAGRTVGTGHAELVAREIDARALGAWLAPGADGDAPRDALADLLERSPIAELTALVVDGPDGKVEGTGRVILRPGAAAAPGRAPVAVEAAAEFALPPGVAGALVGERRAALEKKGALAAHDDGVRLRTRLEWHDGGWLANGVPVEITLPRLRAAQVAKKTKPAPGPEGGAEADATGRAAAGEGDGPAGRAGRAAAEGDAPDHPPDRAAAARSALSDAGGAAAAEGAAPATAQEEVPAAPGGADATPGPVAGDPSPSAHPDPEATPAPLAPAEPSPAPPAALAP